MGIDAVPLLADSVGTFDDAVDLARLLGRGSRSVSMPTTRLFPTAIFSAPAKLLQTSASDLEDERGDISTLLPALRLSRFAEKSIGHGRILALRQSGAVALVGAPGSSRKTISGMVAPYNSLSLDLGGFKELYAPGCFNASLRAGGDPRVCFNHNPDAILGRASAGTARFFDTPVGFSYEADLPETQYARDVRTLIDRHDVNQSSAAFIVLRHRWELRDGQRVRVIEEAQLIECSPVSFAAYAETTATMQISPDDPVRALKRRLLALGPQAPDVVFGRSIQQDAEEIKLRLAALI
jgi:hypothetical protein